MFNFNDAHLRIIEAMYFNPEKKLSAEKSPSFDIIYKIYKQVQTPPLPCMAYAIWVGYQGIFDMQYG